MDSSRRGNLAAHEDYFGAIVGAPEPPEIQLTAVGEPKFARAGPQRAVLRLEADDRDPRAGRQGVPVPAQTQQHRWRPAFDLPPLDGAVRLLHVDVQPGVRVHPLHHDHLAVQRHLLVRVELGGKE